MSDEITTIFIHDLQELQEELEALRTENARLITVNTNFRTGHLNIVRELNGKIDLLQKENADLHTKMDGMVCKRCYRSDGKLLTASGRTEPCPVCQPKEGV